jgi:HlyD family secretion protein
MPTSALTQVAAAPNTRSAPSRGLAVRLRPFFIPAVAALALFLAVGSVLRLRQIRVPASPPAHPPTTSFASAVAGVGLVEPNTENIALSVPVAGWVTAVYARAGDKVAIGQPLFALDDRDLRAELAVRRAQVAQAQAHVSAAEADLADAELLRANAARLDRERVISLEEGRRKAIAADGARARLEEARAQVALAEAQVHQTEVNLQRLTVTAPLKGTVLQSDVRLGQYAASGPLSKPLMILGNTEPLHVCVDVDEQDAWRVRADATATASVRGNSDQRARLRFVRFEPYIVPKQSLTGSSTERVDTRVLQAIYRLDPAGAPRVFVGQQVDVFIESPPPAPASDSPRFSPIPQ